MTAAKIDNQLYQILKGRVSNALDLEYAIRAAELHFPRQMKSACSVRNDLCAYWLEEGFTHDEIFEESLMDASLDSLQFGAPTLARQGRGGPKVAEVIKGNLKNMRERFNDRIDDLRFPPSKYFRVSDLLAGNDIAALFQVVEAKLQVAASGKYKASSRIPAEELNFSVREPFHVHPAFAYGADPDKESFIGVKIDLNGAFNLQDWQRQMHQFQHLFGAIRRGRLREKEKRDVSRDLMFDYLAASMEPTHSEFPLKDHRSFLSRLAGLYCWDLQSRVPLPLRKKSKQAVEITLELYSRQHNSDDEPTTDGISKSCRDAAKYIQAAGKRFDST